MKKFFTLTVFVSAVFVCFVFSVSAQMKTRKADKKTAAKTVPPANTETVETAETKTPVKKNERPESQTETTEPPQKQEPQKKNQSPKTAVADKASKTLELQNDFFYEFTQPNFLVSHIIIEHDVNGKGKITFEKKGFGGDSITDPIQLSAAALDRINNLIQTLNFFDSTEDYQSPIRQYPHLGTMKIRLKKDGRERAVEFNWTENKDAKALADEYRKISQQFIWIFDISVSLENQPLEAPGLMDQLDSMLKRSEVSDAQQLVPVLKKLVNDERIPLIARNHAARMVKDIEKNTAKK
jgi:hypothetical protein